MNTKFKIFMFFLLMTLQILINCYAVKLKFNIDLFYLVIVYISIKFTFLRSILIATLMGWITDYFTGGIIGVYGFSRTVSASLLNQFSKYIDLRRNFIVFLVISISLFFSNLIAGIFLKITAQFNITTNLLIIQPLLTGLTGLLIISFSKAKEHLNVY